MNTCCSNMHLTHGILTGYKYETVTLSIILYVVMKWFLSLRKHVKYKNVLKKCSGKYLDIKSMKEVNNSVYYSEELCDLCTSPSIYC
jgi:hypothetical protein